MRRLLPLLTLLALVGGCATTATYVAPERRAEPVPPLPGGEIAHRVFLTGNTGDLADGGSEAVLRAFATDARAAGENATIALLGDVTADGIPADDALPLARTLIMLLEGAFLLCRAGRTTEPMRDAGAVAVAEVRRRLA